MLSAALNSLIDALSLLLRNQLEKRAVLENLDMVLLCLDETIDDGCVRDAVVFGVILIFHIVVSSWTRMLPLLRRE